MKKLLMLLVAANFANFAMAAETKKVCKTEGKKEVCKTIKVHKKLDATKIPPK